MKNTKMKKLNGLREMKKERQRRKNKNGETSN